MARPKAQNPRTKTANIRLTEEERAEIESTASAHGYSSVSEYLRFLHTRFNEADADDVEPQGVNPRDYPAKLLRPFLKTDHGQIFWVSISL